MEREVANLLRREVHRIFAEGAVAVSQPRTLGSCSARALSREPGRNGALPRAGRVSWAPFLPPDAKVLIVGVLVALVVVDAASLAALEALDELLRLRLAHVHVSPRVPFRALPSDFSRCALLHALRHLPRTLGPCALRTQVASPPWSRARPSGPSHAWGDVDNKKTFELVLYGSDDVKNLEEALQIKL